MSYKTPIKKTFADKFREVLNSNTLIGNELKTRISVYEQWKYLLSKNPHKYQIRWFARQSTFHQLFLTQTGDMDDSHTRWKQIDDMEHYDKRSVWDYFFYYSPNFVIG